MLRNFLVLMISILHVLSYHPARAETGDKADWLDKYGQVSSNPQSVAMFDMLHKYQDGWTSVHRPDIPFAHIYEHHNADGTYTCNMKDNGAMKMQHVVSKTACAAADIKASAP